MLYYHNFRMEPYPAIAASARWKGATAWFGLKSGRNTSVLKTMLWIPKGKPG